MKQIVPVVVTVMLMAGCSTPLNNTNASYNNNTKTAAPELQVVSNWLLIAKDVADQIKSGTDKIGAPVFVAPPQNPSKFSQAFYTQVVTSLVNQGVTVRKVNDGTAQIVDIDTQLVRFSTDRQVNRRFVFGGPSTTSTTSVYEVIVTTSLIKNAQYVARRTDAYPVNEYDASLYNKETEFNFKVIGG